MKLDEDGIYRLVGSICAVVSVELDGLYADNEKIARIKELIAAFNADRDAEKAKLEAEIKVAAEFLKSLGVVL